MIMPDTGAEGALLVGERLRQAVEETMVEAGEELGPLRVTVSIGIATAAKGVDSATFLQQRADAALYRAKGAGRNRVVSDDLDTPVQAVAARA